MAPQRMLMLLALALAGALSACGGGTALAPAPTPHPAATLQSEANGATTAALASALLRVDLDSLSLSLEAGPSLRSATANDSLALLDLARFFDADTFHIGGFRIEGDALAIDLTITHPYPSPDLTLPGSATNRADLGFAGRVMVLAEVPSAERASHRFFGGTIKADTSLVQSPDGYLQPRGLIPTDLFANTFPYLLVVDEARDNRLGVSNDGAPTGSYNPDTGGWQRLNLGPDRTGWTGYGVLHQGQAARVTLRLNREALVDGQVTVPLVLLAKYIQPKGGLNPKAHYLPAATPKVDHFAYRMPYGALDVERILPLLTPRLEQLTPGAEATLEIAVRDWDARSLPTTQSSLALDMDVSHIQPGGVGLPTVAFDAPLIDPGGIRGLHEIAPGARSGHAGDEIRFGCMVQAGTALAQGTYWGMVRVADAEASDSARLTGYETQLSNDLQPITDLGQLAEPVTYQAIPIVVKPRSLAPTCGDCHLSTGSFRPAKPFTLNLSSLIDDSPVVRVTIGYAGAANATASALVLAPSAFVAEAAFDPWNDPRLETPLTPPIMHGDYNLTITLADDEHEVLLDPLPFTFSAPGSCPEEPFAGDTVTVPPQSEGVLDLAALLPAEFTPPIAPPILAIAGFRHKPDWMLTQGASGVFYRINPLSGQTQSATTPGYPGAGWSNRAHLLELDHRGRAFWVASNIDQDSQPNPSLGSLYQFAGSVVHVFNAAGPALASGDLTSFDAGSPVVAMAIDEEDAVWIVDADNNLRCFSEVGGSYVEEPSSGIGLPGSTAGGIMGAVIFDLDINYHNGAFFLAARLFTDRLALWRVECGGDLESPAGNSNPLVELLDRPILDASLVIDNYGPSGQILNGQQDAQLLLAVETGEGWQAVITSELEKRSSVEGSMGASELGFLYHANRAYAVANQESLLSGRYLSAWSMPPGWY